MILYQAFGTCTKAVGVVELGNSIVVVGEEGTPSLRVEQVAVVVVGLIERILGCIAAREQVVMAGVFARQGSCTTWGCWLMVKGKVN
jgi:hypothetical protein